MIYVRLPWVDPRLVSREEMEARTVLDLNREFRAYLFSAECKHRVASEAVAEIRTLERLPELSGSMVWRLYRAVRLSSLVNASLRDQESVEAYLHLLATGPSWYFTDTQAWQHGENASDLSDIGRLFELFFKGRDIPAATIPVTDPAQLPFATILQKVSGAEIVHPNADLSPEIHIDIPSLSKAAAYFSQFPDRLLPVTWSPEGNVTPKIRRLLQKLHSNGIPVSLQFSPVATAVDPDAFIFEAMDEVLRLEPYVREFKIRTAYPALSDILTVQLQAELNDQHRLAPHRLRRTAVSSTTRVKANIPQTIKSHFDLAVISKTCDPGKDAHPYRLGRGIPKVDAPHFSRQSRYGSYMLFSECARAIPVREEDAGYAEAVAFFSRTRRASAFAAEYGVEQQSMVYGLLENLVNLGVLSAS